jgi:hypothetical protein
MSRNYDKAIQIYCIVILLGSPHENAVRVEVQEQTVGYLPPDVARAYRRLLEENAYLNARGICKARITSRMYRSIGADYVIRLDLPEKK